MSKPLLFISPTFKKVPLASIRLAHWRPVTLYTKARWFVQALVVLAFVLVPSLYWLKLDFANDHYWLFGHEVSRSLALQAVVVLWLGTYFINFFENYLIGRLLCGWICPWGLLNRLGMLLNHMLRHVAYRLLIVAMVNVGFALVATLVVMHWLIDLRTLGQPQHAAFTLAWGGFGLGVVLGFVVLQRLSFRFCETICPFGMYLTVVTQKNSLRVVFDASRPCVEWGLCTQVCPMDLSPREMDFNDAMNGGFGQCILCGDCIDVCQTRMQQEGLPAPLRWNTAAQIVPLLPPAPPGVP
ncbi:MAG: 4Fe-4S binding protein [Candidatus Tectimicrobiota bacterium]